VTDLAQKSMGFMLGSRDADAGYGFCKGLPSCSTAKSTTIKVILDVDILEHSL